MKSHDQVEKIAPLKQVTDQKNEYQPEEKEDDQKIKNGFEKVRWGISGLEAVRVGKSG